MTCCPTISWWRPTRVACCAWTSASRNGIRSSWRWRARRDGHVDAAADGRRRASAFSSICVTVVVGASSRSAPSPAPLVLDAERRLRCCLTRVVSVAIRVGDELPQDDRRRRCRGRACAWYSWRRRVSLRTPTKLKNRSLRRRERHLALEERLQAVVALVRPRAVLRPPRSTNADVREALVARPRWTTSPTTRSRLPVSASDRQLAQRLLEQRRVLREVVERVPVDRRIEEVLEQLAAERLRPVGKAAVRLARGRGARWRW